MKKRQLASFEWAVKQLLQNRANFDIVEGFLSELLGYQVVITNVLEDESNKKRSFDKVNRVDMIVENESGELIFIDLQFIFEMDYYQRMLYGASKIIVERMIESEQYIKIKKIYSINIVYFDLGKGTDYVYFGKTDFKGLHNHDTLQLSKDQQCVFGAIDAGEIFPEYYVLKIKNFNDIVKNTLDEWLYFFKYDRIEEGFSAKGLLKTRNILDYSRLSPEDKDDFDYDQDVKSHIRSQIASAKLIGRSEVKEECAKRIAEKDKEIAEQDKTIAEYNKAIAEKDKTIAEYNKAIAEKDKAIAEYDEAIAEKDKAIAEYDEAIAEYDEAIAEYDEAIAEKDKEIAEYDKAIAEKDKAIEAAFK
jgi:predicted transposase/invertase (TIGR01784 family)